MVRLKQLGFDPVASWCEVSPPKKLEASQGRLRLINIVVGHRQKSASERWWSGRNGAYLIDYTDCSLLVFRNVISGEAIEVALQMSDQNEQLIISPQNPSLSPGFTTPMLMADWEWRA